MAAAAAGGRSLTLIHFNDVYNIEASERDPVGGAARFVAKVKALVAASPAGNPPLVLFSGDAFNPSLMSTITLGAQMVPVLNACGVTAACVGNHDCDFGVDNFIKLAAQCNFPWLMANVLDAETGEPLGGVRRSLLLPPHPCGLRVGLVGLVEPDWVDTLATVEPESVRVLDFVQEGRRLAAELRAAGADVVIALTHMRVPNDMLLAQQAPEIDAVLGGHDHHYQVEVVAPHGVLVVKSGTDFKDLTEVTLTLPAAAASAAAAGQGADGQQQQQQQAPPNGQQQPQQRPQFSWRRHTITSDLPEDPEMVQVVEKFSSLMGSRMGDIVAHSTTDLDGRFTTVRTRESNLCNLFSDVFRRACSADVCILNSGTFRSDTIHPAGPITYRDLVTILPMLDETVVLQVTGEQLLGALENGVSQWPKLEGRFPQVSGIRFAFDASAPPGARVVASSITIGSERAPLDRAASYTLATKAYLAEGKDGYTVLEGSKEMVGPESCMAMPTVMRLFFNMLEVLNQMNPQAKVAAFAKRWRRAAKHVNRDRTTDLLVTGNCVRDADSGRFVVAPVLDGRITIINGSDAAKAAAPRGDDDAATAQQQQAQQQQQQQAS